MRERFGKDNYKEECYNPARQLNSSDAPTWVCDRPDEPRQAKVYSEQLMSNIYLIKI